MQAAIGLICDHSIEVEAFRSVLALLAEEQDDFHGRVITHQGFIGRLDKARNNVIRTFGTLVPTGAEWLLFVDSDMVFTPEDYRALRANADPARAPWVSGLYFRDTDPPSPCAFEWGADGKAKPVKLPKGRGTIAVDAVGLGFSLIHYSVFDSIYNESMKTNHWGRTNIEEPWCDNGQLGPGGQPLADDLSLCYRAGQMGYKIKLVRSAHIGHLKMHTVYGEQP